MNKLLKKILLIMFITLLPAACGPFAPTSAPEPVVVSEPTQDIPTLALPMDVSAENFDQYIGLQYPPFPANLRQDFSMLIQDADGYGLFLVTDGGNKMLWLSKLANYDANGDPNWEVKDVLALSDLESGLMLLPDGCLLNSVPDSQIFVAGRKDVIVLAWRANTTLGVFETMAIDGIRCSSDKAIDL